jgi:two-component system, OmpR family, phosphate regulon sensor histidine kinase PhoR
MSPATRRRRSIRATVAGLRPVGPSGWPARRALLWAGALLVLVLGTAGLLQRREAAESEMRFFAHGRALAEMVAQAAGSETTFADPARLLRILESATRQSAGGAGAVFDAEGRILAHTDIARIGSAAGPGIDLGSGQPAPDELRRALFGARAGAVFLHPLLDANGTAGAVALLLPAPPREFLAGNWWRTLLPVGLMLLAFIALTQMATRWALRPTAEFLERLARALEQPGTSGESAAGAGEPADRAMERTVTRVNELHAAREALTIENRVLDYERRRAALVLEHFPDGLILTDALDQALLVNRATATLLGLTREPGSEAPPALPPAVRGLLDEARRTGRVVHETAAGDRTRQILITRCQLADMPARGAGALYVLRDVTAQRAVQQAQAEFLSQITHELKSPLNTIVAYVEALTDEDQLGPDERREFYNTLNAEALRMARLISNLLQLSRIQLGNLSAKFAYMKPDTLIHDLTRSVMTQAESRHQRLEVHVPESLPALHGDKDLIGVAITNLLSNAIKYTPEGGQIVVRAAAADGGVMIEVADNGIGIPPEEQTRIFERFARSTQAEVLRQSGTGLGLSLVREIAEIHDGRITVESKLGAGSRFKLWLPSREVGTRMDLGAAA